MQPNDEEIDRAHAVAAAALRCWQRNRASGTARLFAEALGTEAAKLSLARLEAEKAGDKP